MTRRVVAAGQLRRVVAAAPGELDPALCPAALVALHRPPAAALEVAAPRRVSLLERLLGWMFGATSAASVAR